MKNNQQTFSTVVDNQFGTVSLGFSLRSMLKNTNYSSLEDMGNATLLEKNPMKIGTRMLILLRTL